MLRDTLESAHPMANRSASPRPSINESRAQLRPTSCSNTLNLINLPRMPPPLTLSISHFLFINSFVLSFQALPQMLTSFLKGGKKRKAVRLLWWLWRRSFYSACKFSLLRGRINIPHWAHNGVRETQPLQNT